MEIKTISDTAAIFELPKMDLPTDWRLNLPSDSTQKIGDAFAAGLKYLVLRVPSAVVPGDFNYLINPSHQMMNEVTIGDVEPFEFDSRFASRGE